MKLHSCLFIMITIMVFTQPIVCIETANAIGPLDEKPVEQANISNFNGRDLVSFTTATSSYGLSSGLKVHRTVDSIIDEN